MIGAGRESQPRDRAAGQSKRWALPGLTRANVGREIVAGITLIAISVPLNIGYAEIAGLPATAGLYALIVPSLIFALMASSRQVVVAPDAAAAALVASSLAGLGVATAADYAEMAAAQALLGGAMFLVCARLKLGFLANFLSKPILVGFVGGLALEITLSQVAKMLGISLPDEEFFSRVGHLATHLGEAHGWTLAVSIPAVIILALGRSRAPAIPWSLIVLVTATVVTVLVDLPAKGVAILGEVPAGLPELAIPTLTFSQWAALIPSALALTAVTVAEGLMVGRSYAEKNGYSNDPDRDLAGFGLANIGAGLTSSFSVGSSTSRTAAMDSSGSRTQLPGIVLALGSLLLLLVGADLLTNIPAPAIGATVAVAVFGLLGIKEFRELWAGARDEFVIAATAFGGVLVIGPIGGIVVAFFLALVNLTRKAAVAHVELLHLTAGLGSPGPDDLGHGGTQTIPGVVVARLAGPAFFANSAAVVDAITDLITKAEDPVRWLVLDLETLTDLDTTAAESFGALEDHLQVNEVVLALTRIDPAMAQRLNRLEVFCGATRYPTNRAAIAAFHNSAGEAG